MSVRYLSVGPFEVLSRLRIHAVQYGLLGLSLSLFSLLLLSLAEPIGYTIDFLKRRQPGREGGQLDRSQSG